MGIRSGVYLGGLCSLETRENRTQIEGRSIRNDQHLYHIKRLQELMEGGKGEKKYSYSGLHFGHYKIAERDYQLSKHQAARVYLEVKGVHTFRTWCKGLSVMLDNKPSFNEVIK